MTDADEGISLSEASGGESEAPGTCKFKKTLLSGLPPRRSQVEALMKSLELRGVLGPPEKGHAMPVASRGAETAEPRPQAAVESGALATVLAFSTPRKTGKDK